MSNKLKPLSSEEQHALREKAKNELERLEGVYADNHTREKIHTFKEKYGICEIVYKVVWDDHQFNKTGKHPDRMKVDMTQVPYTLSYAGYDFNRTLLAHLFGAKERVGSRSVKKLRDALTHSLNQRAVDELIDREAEIHGYMDQFLEKVREYDSAA